MKKKEIQYKKALYKIIIECKDPQFRKILEKRFRIERSLV